MCADTPCKGGLLTRRPSSAGAASKQLRLGEAAAACTVQPVQRRASESMLGATFLLLPLSWLGWLQSMPCNSIIGAICRSRSSCSSCIAIFAYTLQVMEVPLHFRYLVYLFVYMSWRIQSQCRTARCCQHLLKLCFLKQGLSLAAPQHCRICCLSPH